MVLQRASTGLIDIAEAADEAWALLRALVPNATPKIIIIFGEPRAKARPRFGGNAYVDAKDREQTRALAWEMKLQCREQFAGDVALVCIFCRSTRRSIDTDNMLKQVCDAAKGVLWKDDVQVAACTAVRKLGVSVPRTVIAICHYRNARREE